MTAITVTETLVKVTCGLCGGVYAIAQRYHKKCYEDAKMWSCPYCRRRWGFPGKSQTQQERERADRAEDRVRSLRCALSATERSLSATKGVVTRTKNRVGKGVCPCCNRHFANVERHMASQHPEYAETP